MSGIGRVGNCLPTLLGLATIYEGTAAAQRGLVGGGNQVFIKTVDKAWIVK